MHCTEDERPLDALKELTEKEDGQAQRPLHKMIALWEAKIKGQETMQPTRLRREGFP